MKEDLVQKARTTIQNMDEEKFGQFQTELQFAVKWYQEGRKAAQACMACQDGETSNIYEAPSAVINFPDKEKEVGNSPLYKIVREEIVRREVASEVPDNWCGWLGLATADDQKNINDAVGSIMAKKFPIGLIGPGPDVDGANKTLESYGIQRIFVDSPDLMKTFFEHYD